MYHAHNFQKAVYEKLQADSALMAQVSGVYDQVQDGVKLPYVLITEVEIKDWSSATTKGVECFFEVRCFSRQGGRKECSLIVKRVQELLHEATLTLPAPDKLVLMRLINSRSHDDGQNYRESSRFRALIQVA